MDGRQIIRRLVEPPAGGTRRIPLGPARGLVLASEPAETASADLWVGLFESELAPYVRRFCRPGLGAVDVGANSGYYTLTLGHLCKATVVAYEPDPEARVRLDRNLRLNPEIASRVAVRPAAVAAVPEDGAVTLDVDLADAGSIGLLKIDVDGGEVGVLTGARRLLTDQHPSVILETHSLDLETACARLLLDAGYAPRVVTARRMLRQNRPAEHNRWLVAAGAGVT